MDVHRSVETWEIVQPKKSGKTAEPLSKAKKKILLEKMPTIEPNAPVEESKTIYDAFIKDEEKKERRARELEQTRIQSNQIANSGGVSKKGGPSNKKTGEKSGGGDRKKDKPIKLEEAVSLIDAKELEGWLSTTRLRFPDSPEVWLKDLASLLNLALDKVPEADPACVGKPLDYPRSLLSKPVNDLLQKVIRTSSVRTLSAFLEFCLEAMLMEQSKGMPTFGYWIFIQAILMNKPEIVVNSIDMYLALLLQNVNRPRRALSILWTVGQAGLTDLANGLKVWLGLMLPVLDRRSLSDYSVFYLEQHLKRHADLKSGFPGLSKKDFFKLFDELFSQQSSLTSDLRKRLQALYPKLKVVVWGAQSDSTLHNMFSSFLSRCTSDCPAPKKLELLSCLVECLKTDQQSFSVWRQVYVKHLAQSSRLLKYLLDNLDKNDGINQKLLRETVRAFSLTNEELSTDAVAHTAHFQDCVSSCKELLERLSVVRFPWRRVLGIVTLLFVAIIVCDSYASGGFYKSRSYRTLDDLGVVTFLTQTWKRLLVYLTLVFQWLVVNVPYYYGKTVEIISPYVLVGWEKLVQYSIAAGDALRPVLKHVWSSITLLQQWLEKNLPPFLEFLSLYLSIALKLVSSWTLWLFTHICRYITIIRDWLLMHVLVGNFSPENIVQVFSSGLLAIQSYVVSFYLWCSSLLF